MGALAMNVNRNKRSIVLDLKSDDGHAALMDLLATADVLVTNMRPGALTRLGLDAEDVAQRFPKLVYCRAQGFRSDSELADRAAYDEIVGVLGLAEPAVDLGDLADPLRDLAAAYDLAAAGPEGVVEALIARRAQARREAAWALGDEIRDRLGELGILLEDGPDGTVWRRR